MTTLLHSGANNLDSPLPKAFAAEHRDAEHERAVEEINDGRIFF
jgi:hypothetical protein